jgi:hypothetical protein
MDGGNVAKNQFSRKKKHGYFKIYPLRRKSITTKWIYLVKTNLDGSIIKLKVKLVACGFQ